MKVNSDLNALGIKHMVVELGEVEILKTLTEEKRKDLQTALLRSGLELMEDKKSILIEKIKNIVIELVHYSDDEPKPQFSEYLSSKLGYDYKYLSSLFSDVKGTTIETFIIAHKIERVKELLLYDELNLTEISYKLNYSSVAHLSAQFKKVTGLTPTFFKQMKHARRKVLESL